MHNAPVTASVEEIDGVGDSPDVQCRGRPILHALHVIDYICCRAY